MPQQTNAAYKGLSVCFSQEWKSLLLTLRFGKNVWNQNLKTIWCSHDYYYVVVEVSLKKKVRLFSSVQD